jgi:hypothetical protein
MAVILFKVAVALAFTSLGIQALRSPALMEVSERSFIGRALAFQLLPTLALFIALYVIGNQHVTSDVPAFYLPAARAVIAGHVPFRDFSLSYGPLFSYVGAAIILLWDSGETFVLFAILMNALALLLWHWAAVTCVDRDTARQSTILYATSGHIALQTILGTHQVWIAAGLAASTLLLMQDRSWSSGLVQAVAVCTTKFLTMLFWPVLWICAPRRTPWLVGALLLGGVVYGSFALGGADVLYPLRREGGRISSGNIPYLIDPLAHAASLSNPHLFDGVALCVLAVASFWLYWNARTLAPQRRPALIFAGLVLVGFIFVLISKKSFTGYVAFFMYPAITILVRDAPGSRVSKVFLLLFNALLAAEPSVWFRLGGSGQALQDWLPHVGLASAVAFVSIEVMLLACYCYLTCLSVCSVRRTIRSAVVPQTAGNPAPASPPA